nr:hypothetical protein [Deltaproteobacteria bacterium]
IASLPPELQAFIGHRPDGAMRAIDELSDALRSVELLSRAAANGTAFESTRGPRLMMPAGLGGLVSAIDRAHLISEQPAALAGQRAQMRFGQDRHLMPAGAPSMGAPAMGAMSPAMRAAASARVPTMSFLSAPTARTIGADPRMMAMGPMGTIGGAPAATSALEAATTASPAALTHVAWADRWLARFAGASQQSLDTLSAAGGFDRVTRMQALASAAPGSVFVAPMFDREREAPAAMRTPFAAPTSVTAPAMPTLSIVPPASSTMSTSASTSMQQQAAPSDVPAPRLIERMPEAVRYDDDAETPDEVFAQIAAGVTRSRTAAPTAPTAAPSTTTYGAPLTSVPVPSISPMLTADRYTAADAVAHAAPNAPGAGFAAQLASSPFAPALRHVLPLSSAQSFDVRALFGGGLSATYLAGLLASSSDEVHTGARMLPSWAAWTQEPSIGGGAEGFEPASMQREAPAWDATYVAPDALDLPADMRADVGADARAEMAMRAEMPGMGAEMPAMGAADVAASQPMIEARAQLEAATEQLTTLRSTLLSWNVESTPSGAAFVPSPDVVNAPSIVSRTSSSPMTTATARTMIEAMSLPMLGDASAPEPTHDGAAWTAPGMVADRAHSWSVAQERSSADLSFDFVPPELVLAARVYGLGPAEAAQAARLALAGPGHLTAMAGTVDRTFVQAMSMEAERRERAQLATAYPTSSGEIAAATRALSSSSSSSSSSSTASSSSMPAPATSLANASDASGGATAESIAASMSSFTQGSGGTAFGVDRKTPRGAFLWPSATVAALGLTAGVPEGQQTMSIAALELLAAQAVAELGTFTALSDNNFSRDVIDASSTEVSRESARTDGVAAEPRSEAARAATLAVARGDAAQTSGAEPAEADVLASVSALIPASRRARFDALYVALSQSSSSTSWSPAARAARALALAGRGEDGPVTARERATFAWDVLPVVYADAIASFGADK